MPSGREPDAFPELAPGSSLRTRSSASLRLSGPDIERVLEALEQPAAICTLDTRILVVNAAFERVRSASSGSLNPDVPLVGDACVREVLLAGSVWQGPSALPGVATLVPLRSGEGDIGACLAVFPDAQAHSEIDRLSTQLEQLRRTESLGQLASGIAHDFNNMLAVILNYVDLAERRLPPAASAADALGHIRDAAERSAEITQQLLTLSRGPASERARVDVNSAVASLRPVIVSTLGERIEYRAELFPGLWPVRLARAQLQRILLNLAANSRDAMQEGGILTVRTANVQVDSKHAGSGPPPGRYVELEIADTGPGMPEEVAAHVFEPFFTTKEVGVGTGLGLSIIHGIVRQAGGEVSVWSRPGIGTTFTLHFPAEDTGVSPTVPSPRPGDVRRTILVVDDERPLRRAVARMLAESGCDVVQAEDGVEALEMMAEREVRVVLTDVLMPRMSGVELAKHLAELYPSTEVVFMSGYTHGLITQSSVEAGELLYLQKPFTKEQLFAKLEEAWERVGGAEEA